MMQLLIIKLVCSLGCFCSFALAQMELGENVAGSVNNFPSLGITCLGNLAVFVTCLIRGRLDLEMCARDILATARGPRLQKIKDSEHGLTTCRGPLEAASVVILSNGIHNSSIRQFVESSALNVDSILLQFLPPKAAKVPECQCTSCHCIVFWNVEKITQMLARVMPGTFKRLPESNFCLLPSPNCLKNDCHGCNHDLLRWEVKHETETIQVWGWTYETYQGPDVHVVCKLLGSSSFAGNSICICIPVHPAQYDGWTNQLAICLRSKDVEGRGVRDMASRAMEEYLDYGRDEEWAVKEGEVKYSILSFLMPRLTEMLINIALTFWFRVDGFSSALVARRAIRDYLVDSKGSGFAANTFLTKAVVMSDYNNQVCQVLTFRGTLLGPRTLSFIMGCINLICSIGWAVLIAFDGGADSSSPPSKLGIIVIVVAIGIALAMDSFHLYFNFNYSAKFYYPGKHGESQAAQHERAVPFEPTPALKLTIVRQTRTRVMVLSVIVLEIVCIVSCTAVARVLGTKGFGLWLYGALQGLVWVKWGIGSYVLSEYSPEFFGDNPEIWKIIIYSSAFMLNAVLAGVRCKCGPWPWKDNHLF